MIEFETTIVGVERCYNRFVRIEDTCSISRSNSVFTKAGLPVLIELIIDGRRIK